MASRAICSLTQTSLPWVLAAEYTAHGEDVLIVNLSRFGHTLRRIGEQLDVEFQMWIEHQFSWKFDAVLFSAGGNDFIDAALVNPPQ